MTIGVEYDRKKIDYKKAGGAPMRLEHATRTGKLDFDSSYPNTGGTVGEPLTAAMLQMTEVYFVSIPPKGGYRFQYDYTNSVVHVYISDSDGVADGPAVELANGTNLATLVDVRFLVIGRVANY